MERKILHIDVNNAFCRGQQIDRLKHGETFRFKNGSIYYRWR